MEKVNLMQVLDEWPDDVKDEELQFDEGKFRKGYSSHHYTLWMRNILCSCRDEMP